MIKLPKLSRAKTFLTKYKSHVALALIVSVISFVLGHTIAFNKDITWVYANRDNTEALVRNFQETYDVQQKLYTKSQQAFLEVLECFSMGKDSCNVEELINSNKKLVSERDALFNELEKLNSEASGIMARFSLK